MYFIDLMILNGSRPFIFIRVGEDLPCKEFIFVRGCGLPDRSERLRVPVRPVLSCLVGYVVILSVNNLKLCPRVLHVRFLAILPTPSHADTFHFPKLFYITYVETKPYQIIIL
jgi:hypothetical protein